MTQSNLPTVVVTTDLKDLDGHPTLAVGRKYVAPVLELAGCLPLLLPALGEAMPIDALLDVIDGIVLSGSPSNIEPHHYGADLEREDSPADPARDATTLPLIRAAIARGVPVFGICRCFQEINVALGGTLLQQVHLTQGKADHRHVPDLDAAGQYGPAHKVAAVPGGWFERVVGAGSWQVNSLHGQGIARLAPGLVAEALADDGLVEAYVLGDTPAFVCAVQWHPEWMAAENPVSRALYAAFGAACREHAQQRRAQGQATSGTRLTRKVSS